MVATLMFPITVLPYSRIRVVISWSQVLDSRLMIYKPRGRVIIRTVNSQPKTTAIREAHQPKHISLDHVLRLLAPSPHRLHWGLSMGLEL